MIAIRANKAHLNFEFEFERERETDRQTESGFVCVKQGVSVKDYHKSVHKCSLNSTPWRLAVL